MVRAPGRLGRMVGGWEGGIVGGVEEWRGVGQRWGRKHEEGWGAPVVWRRGGGNGRAGTLRLKV